MLEADPSREVAIFGAVWIAAPVDRYLAAVKDIEKFETGENFLATKRISSPPRLQDFDAMTAAARRYLGSEDLPGGRVRAEAGRGGADRCKKESTGRRRRPAADVERAVKKMAFDYVNGYLEGGNARLADTATRSARRLSEPNSRPWSGACRS